MTGRFVTLSLAALVAVTFATSCQREDGPEVMTGNEQEEVTTSFVFNVSTTTAQTKQSGDDTQASGDHFRGIVSAKLFSYNKGDAFDDKILDAAETANKEFDLSSLAAESSISADQSRRVLEMSLPLKSNIMLLYGKAGIPPYTPTGGITASDRYGKLDRYVVTKEQGSAYFSLGKRLQDPDRFYITERLLAGILTVIMTTQLEDEDDDLLADHAINATDVEGGTAYGFDLPAESFPALKWRDYANTTKSPYDPTHDLYPLEEKLQFIYKQVTTIRSDQGELRAASGLAIIRTVTDMWSSLNSIRCSRPTSEAEAIAKHLAYHIDNHIRLFFNSTSRPDDGSSVSGVSFKVLSDMITNFNNSFSTRVHRWPAHANPGTASPYRPSATELATLLGSTGTPAVASVVLNDFPFGFNMPRGVAYLAFDTDSLCFYFPQKFNTSAMGGTPTAGNEYDANSYYFPSELLYFGNSPLRVSDLEHTTSSYPASSAKWNDDDEWDEKVPSGSDPVDPADEDTWKYDWHGSHVKSTTRSVAMKYDINYGVAMLETKVGYKSGLTYLEDNNHAVQAVNAGYPTTAAYDEDGHANDEPNKRIPITGTSFKLTGVIIGGQPQTVGWDFLPKKSNPDDSHITTGFIYDKYIPAASQAIPASGVSVPNYTVVFDNYNDISYKGGTTQDIVYVALEFQNLTGEDFFGNCNLVRNEGYFYLIGALSPVYDATTNPFSPIVWPTNGYRVPPYYTTGDDIPSGSEKGDSKKVTRVFVQDFMTSVSFKFGQKSLQAAYLSVPDLRSSSVTLGMSVDIQWSQGLQYDEVILGGN